VWLDDLDAILKRLVERDFIVSREISAFAGSSEYIFAQNMLRDLIYETLLESRRQAYHGRAARWIGEVAGDRSAEYTPMIAEHYEQAGQQDKAAECLRKAGKRALAVCAFTDACRLLEHALSLLPDAAHVERLDASLALADSLVKLAEFPAAQARLEDALHLAQDLGDNAARTEALYQMSQIATHRGDWEAAKSLLAEALPLAREMGACVALAWTLYGLADTYYRTGELEPAQACAEEALALGREMGNGAVERAALNRLATILWVAYGPGSPEFERALHLLEEMHELAQSARDRRMALTALVNLGAMQREIGDHQASLGYMSQALAQAREIGNTIGVIVASLNLAIEYCLDLQPDRARPLTIEALRLARQIGSETWLAAGLVAIGAIRIAAGDQSSGLAALGLARSHPAAGRDELKDVQYVLDGLLGERSNAAITQSGLETGEGLDLDKVVDAFLEQAGA
jgi:tetratricopeptide (TPR) repeat protein